MVVVKKLGQLLAQALVALALVTEDDRPFEQRVLNLLRQVSPEFGGGRSKNEEVTGGAVSPGGVIRLFLHGTPNVAHVEMSSLPVSADYR